MHIIVEIMNSIGGGKVYDSLWDPRNELLLCPNHSTETFFVECIISYSKSKKPQNVCSFIMEEKLSNVDAFIVFFCCLYKHVSKLTRKNISF